MNDNLKKFFEEHPKCAIAFSGGCDSVYLMHCALECGCDVRGYFIRSEFNSLDDRNSALETAFSMGACVSVVQAELLDDPSIVDNDCDRCYYCKRTSMQAMIRKAYVDGYNVFLDGTNADDYDENKPSCKALKELRIISPLALCGVGRKEVREGLKEANLPAAEMPETSCTAARIEEGMQLNKMNLGKVESCENFLKKRGFSDFRVYLTKEGGKISLTEVDYPKAMEIKGDIISHVKKTMSNAVIDENFRKSK